VTRPSETGGATFDPNAVFCGGTIHRRHEGMKHSVISRVVPAAFSGEAEKRRRRDRGVQLRLRIIVLLDGAQLRKGRQTAFRVLTFDREVKILDK